MDKKVLKQIRQFAAMLPVVTSPCKARVTGAEVLKHKPNATDAEGNPLKEDMSYLYESEVRHNHVRAMKKIYKSQGEAGLLKYAAMMKDFEDGRMTMLGNVIGGMVERKASAIPGF